MFWIGMAYGAALHRRYVRPVGIDLHLMVITDEEEWNTGPAHSGVATNIRGNDRVVADSAQRANRPLELVSSPEQPRIGGSQCHDMPPIT